MEGSTGSGVCEIIDGCRARGEGRPLGNDELLRIGESLGNAEEMVGISVGIADGVRVTMAGISEGIRLVNELGSDV